MKVVNLIFLFVSCLLLHATETNAHQQFHAQQTVVVTGKVTDASGNPLAGVSVAILNSNEGTTTGPAGNFSITAPSTNATLVFSYVGYTARQLPLNGRTNVNVTLATTESTMGEVVVIGYGTQRRENVIGSIATLSADKLADRPVTQLKNALTGQLAGVTITQDNGRPGVPSGSIRVRGVGSFGAAPDALILVDGIPVGGFNEIDPNDVESISVLKDASSAAIYGARAANGVILVTTKSGKEGKARVTYNGYVGVQRPTSLPEFVDSWQYAIAFAESNGTIDDPSTLEAIEKYRSGSDPENYPNTDFIGGILKKNSLQTSHNVNVSGGTNLNRYNLSIGYLFQDGIIAENNYSRYNVRLNMVTELSKKLSLTTRLAVINGDRNEPMSPPTQTNDMLDIIDQAARLPASYAARYSNGDWGGGVNGNGNPFSQLASPSFYKANELNLNGNLRLDYQIINDLKLSMITSYVKTMDKDKAFQSTQRINASVFVGPNRLTQTTASSDYYTMQGLAEYTKRFGRHQVNVLGGYSFEKFRNESMRAFRDNLPGNDLTVIDLGAGTNQQSNGTAAEWAIESQFARANYSYAGKYLIEGVVRRDGSSRFPQNYKYAVFPSVAVGWRIGEEDFIKQNYPWISELKIKASRGVLGNQNISNYPYQNVLEADDNVRGTNYSFGGSVVTGVARTTIVDSTLHWESTRTTDVGIEFGLFGNKLMGSATYFDRYTYDILYSPSGSVSSILGFGLSQMNTGKLENTGWEFTLNYNEQLGKVGVNLNTNFSIIKNKALDLGVGNIIQPNGLIGNGSSLFIGYPMQLYYGYIADGIFTDAADVAAWHDMTKVNPAPQPGDIRYKDISGPGGKPDGVVDPTYDRTYLGSQIPKYTYGVNFGVNYAGFDFSALLQGIAGVKGNLTAGFGYALFNLGNVQKWQFEGRWTEANPNRYAIYPRMEQIANSGTPNSQLSSFWTLNGSYLRIKNLQLGYTLPKTVLQAIKISTARVYLSGENIHTFSNYRKGWDPEINTGTNFYPILSNYTLGLNITF
jgi:TonB-linked SusC/RagA family outer membrane protein